MAQEKILSAKKVVADLRAGATDDFLMKKYGISEKGLQSLFQKLVAAKVLTQGDLDRRTHVVEEVGAVVVQDDEALPVLPAATSTSIGFKCPSCGLPQNHEFKVCPQCGIIVDKFLSHMSSKSDSTKRVRARRYRTYGVLAIAVLSLLAIVGIWFRFFLIEPSAPSAPSQLVSQSNAPDGSSGSQREMKSFSVKKKSHTVVGADGSEKRATIEADRPDHSQRSRHERKSLTKEDLTRDPFSKLGALLHQWPDKPMPRTAVAPDGGAVEIKRESGITIITEHSQLQVEQYARDVEAHRRIKRSLELIEAAYTGDLDRSVTLLEQGADPNRAFSGVEKCTSLMAACLRGHNEIAEILIAKGAQVNASDKKGWTPLFYAAVNGHLTIVKLLLISGVDSSHQTEDKVTPEVYAEAAGHTEVAEILRTAQENRLDLLQLRKEIAAGAVLRGPPSSPKSSFDQKAVTKSEQETAVRSGPGTDRSFIKQELVQSDQVAAYIRLLKHGFDVDEREEGARCLGLMKDSRAVEPLISAFMEDENLMAAWALGQIKDPRAVEHMIRALKHENPRVRSQAAYVLAETPDSRAVQPLVSALNDEDTMVRENAAGALGRIGDRSCVENLIRMLTDGNDWEREKAAGALGAIGDPRALGPLTAALNDKNPLVRGQAKAALQIMRSSRR